MLTGARLVTLTGAGGIGKTRLALAVGETIRNEVSGGVWIVELAKTHEPDTVDALIASALGLVTSGPQTGRDTCSERSEIASSYSCSTTVNMSSLR